MAEDDDKDDELEGGRMPLLDHLTELRNRLIWSFGAIAVTFLVCYQFKTYIYEFLAHPLFAILGAEPGRKMIFTGLTEAFFTYIKVSFWAAICLSFPIIAWQVWKFVAPGLYKTERGAFLPYLFATPVLFILGASLAYFVVIPFAFRFFLSFETPGGPGQLPIVSEPKVNEYLSLVMTLLFAFGVAFQTAGAADPDGAGRAGHISRPCLQAALCDCRHVRYRRRPDPARHRQPDLPRGAAGPPVRGVDHRLPHGREGAGQARGRGRGRACRRRQARRGRVAPVVQDGFRVADPNLRPCVNR